MVRNKKDSFIFDRNTFESIKSLSDNNRVIMYSAICDYALNGVIPKFSGALKTIWYFIQPKLDRVPRLEADKFISKPEIRNWVFKKYGKKCLACDSVADIALDHIIPISKGGENAKDNLQPLCKSCNSKKRNKIIDYRNGTT